MLRVHLVSKHVITARSVDLVDTYASMVRYIKKKKVTLRIKLLLINHRRPLLFEWINVKIKQNKDLFWGSTYQEYRLNFLMKIFTHHIRQVNDIWRRREGERGTRSSHFTFAEYPFKADRFAKKTLRALRILRSKIFLKI